MIISAHIFTGSYFEHLQKLKMIKNLILSALTCKASRVSTVREKYLENDFFSRSGKSQGIFLMAREIYKGLGKSGKSQEI